MNETNEQTGAARLPRTKAFIALRLCYQSPFAHGTVLFSKEAFRAAGGYLQSERHAEDYALWGRMLEVGEFVGLPQKLLKFRRHSASVSQQESAVQRKLTGKIAIEHCRRFMRLNVGEAERVATLLATPTSERKSSDWLWFLTRCAPRLRWKSAEAAAWLGWQTVKQIAPI